MKPLNSPAYRIPGTNLLNASRWSRENVPKAAPAHKVGDRVLVEVVVTKVYQDCDGTALFAVGEYDEQSRLYGYRNEDLTPVVAPGKEEA